MSYFCGRTERGTQMTFVEADTEVEARAVLTGTFGLPADIEIVQAYDTVASHGDVKHCLKSICQQMLSSAES